MEKIPGPLLYLNLSRIREAAAAASLNILGSIQPKLNETLDSVELIEFGKTIDRAENIAKINQGIDIILSERLVSKNDWQKEQLNTKPSIKRRFQINLNFSYFLN